MALSCLFFPLNTALATEPGSAEPRSSSAAIRPFHGAGHHVCSGDRGLCQAAAGLPGTDSRGPDCPAQDVYH